MISKFQGIQLHPLAPPHSRHPCIKTKYVHTQKIQRQYIKQLFENEYKILSFLKKKQLPIVKNVAVSASLRWWPKQNPFNIFIESRDSHVPSYRITNLLKRRVMTLQ